MSWIERNTGLGFKWWLSSTITAADVSGAFQFVGAKNAEEALRNWVDKDNPASKVDAPTWTRTAGFDFDGTNDALDSGITLGAAATVLVLVNFPTLDGENDRIFGYSGGATETFRFRINRSSSGLISGVVGSAGLGAIVTLAANTDYVIGASGNGNKKLWFDGVAVDTETVSTFNGGGGNCYIGAVNNLLNNLWEGPIKACVIYNRELTETEVAVITANMKKITAATNLSQYVYWITQAPATKHLNSLVHELLIATDGGVYRTSNGGRQWEQVVLPDPSNAEFGDIPAATVDELTFHWCAYDPLNRRTLYAMAAKVSTSRIWIYKSIDNGISWSSRGVEVA